MKERSRVKKTLKFILCIALLLLQNDFNVLAEVNETETEIVDENSYQKINLNEKCCYGTKSRNDKQRFS